MTMIKRLQNAIRVYRHKGAARMNYRLWATWVVFNRFEVFPRHTPT